MKTIKLIILAAFMLPALVSQAQTKEETIAWLKEKLESYLQNTYEKDFFNRNLKLESINECEIVISYEDRMRGDSNYDLNRQTFPTKGLKINKEGLMYFNEKVVKFDNVSDGYVHHYEYVQSIRIDNREENIYERIQKAIAHLATFCPKKQEAF